MFGKFDLFYVVFIYAQQYKNTSLISDKLLLNFTVVIFPS